MEQGKREIHIPYSIRGIKRTFITPKGINRPNKTTSEEKIILNTVFPKLNPIFQLNKNLSEKNFLDQNSNNHCNNRDKKEIQFLVSHKSIFTHYKHYEEAKFSTKSYGSVISYGVSTYKGTVRNYNEDRVSIFLNVIKPPYKQTEEWPKVSFFGIFDGHGGSRCSDFLKENLHHYIFRQLSFPSDPIEAISKGFENAEKDIMQNFKSKKSLMGDYEHSGSCACVVIIIDDNCFVANVGDSRAIYSENSSNKISLLSWDHKPNDPQEKKRIISAGGYIYQGLMNYQNLSGISSSELPWRIFPGRLSVSRAFGDIEAKLPELGGNPKVLISTPQIISFKLKELSDFIVIGSDGIFDQLSNIEIIDSIWACSNEDIKATNIFEYSGKAVDMVMKQSMTAGTVDNISCIFIGFNNFKQIMQQKFQSMNNPIKDTHRENELNEELYTSNSNDLTNKINYEEIRKRISILNDKSIELQTDEELLLKTYTPFQPICENNKPKTSLETNNISRLTSIATSFSQRDTINEKISVNSKSNLKTDPDDQGNNPYKIISKKIKTPQLAPIKKELTLPGFKIPQKDSNIQSNFSKLYDNFNDSTNISYNYNGSINKKILSNTNLINEYSNSGWNNFHFTSNNNSLLPSINYKNKGCNYNNSLNSSNIIGLKNNSNADFKIQKDIKFNFNYN